MKTPRRTFGRAALVVLIVAIPALAGGSALARRAEVNRLRSEVTRLRGELGVGPFDGADDVVARFAARADALRAPGEPTDGQATGRLAETLAAGAASAGLPVEQLAEDPRSSRVTVNTAGTPAATTRWLRGIDGLVVRGSASVLELSLVALPGNVVRAGLTVLAAEASGARSGLASEAIGRESDRGVVARLSWPTRESEPPDAPTASTSGERSPRRAAEPIDTPVYLGTIGVGGEERYAVRVDPHGVVAVVGRGDTRFGWTLVGVDPTRLAFEKEGVRYEVDR
jgi:hypothetical protein